MPTKLYVDFGGYSAIEKGNLIIPRDNILNKEDFDKMEMVVGEILKSQKHPDAKNLLISLTNTCNINCKFCFPKYNLVR